MAKNDPAAIRKLKAYIAKENHNVDQIFDGFDKETDRAAIVIAGSIVEDALRSMLEAHMRVTQTKTEENEIWGSQGVLGTFSAKIRLAYALRLLDAGARKQLDVLREMRNACAHSQMPIDFDTPQLREVCSGFLQASRAKKRVLPETNKGFRSAFESECMWLATTFLKSGLDTYRSSPALKNKTQSGINALAMPSTALGAGLLDFEQDAE